MSAYVGWTLLALVWSRLAWANAVDGDSLMFAVDLAGILLAGVNIGLRARRDAR